MTLTFERAAEFLRPRRWYALAAGVVVWCVWVGSLALGTWETDAVGQLVSVDHLAFYSPARMIREGHAGAIYDYPRLLAYQQGLFPPGVWNAFEAYRNPPFYALLYTPTAGLPYAVSAWLWNGIGVACLVLGVRWLGAERPWAAAGWAMSFLPVFCVASYGQNSLLSLAALAGTYRLLLMRRPFAAGLVAGLLSFKPPLLLGLVVWGLLDIRRLWPAAAGVVVTTATLCGASYLAVPEAWTAFLATIEQNSRYDNFDWWKMHNARGFWLLGAGAGPATTALWLASAVVGLGAFVRVWLARRDDLPVVFGAAVVLTLWASPHVMVYEWALAVIPAVLWWTHVPSRRAEWFVLFAVAWVVFFVSTDCGRAQEMFWRRVVGWEHGGPILQLSVPAVAWVGWHAVRILRAPAPAEPAPPAAGVLDPPAAAPENSV